MPMCVNSTLYTCANAFDDGSSSPDETPIEIARRIYNVSVMASTDYPAMFAIIGGLLTALSLAVLYSVVGMMTMDPGKDSIIYRVTMNRMKKD